MRTSILYIINHPSLILKLIKKTYKLNDFYLQDKIKAVIKLSILWYKPYAHNTAGVISSNTRPRLNGVWMIWILHKHYITYQTHCVITRCSGLSFLVGVIKLWSSWSLLVAKLSLCLIYFLSKYLSTHCALDVASSLHYESKWPLFKVTTGETLLANDMCFIQRKYGC